MKRKIINLVAMVIIGVALSAASCSKLKSAAQAAYDVDVVIKGLQATVESLNKTDSLSNEAYLEVLYAERDLLDANREFRSTLVGLKEITPDNATNILIALDKLSLAANNLAQRGTLRIKSQSTKDKVMLAVTALRTSIATINAFLGGIKSPQPIGGFIK